MGRVAGGAEARLDAVRVEGEGRLGAAVGAEATGRGAAEEERALDGPEEEPGVELLLALVGVAPRVRVGGGAWPLVRRPAPPLAYNPVLPSFGSLKALVSISVQWHGVLSWCV